MTDNQYKKLREARQVLIDLEEEMTLDENIVLDKKEAMVVSVLKTRSDYIQYLHRMNKKK